MSSLSSFSATSTPTASSEPRTPSTTTATTIPSSLASPQSHLQPEQQQKQNSMMMLRQWRPAAQRNLRNQWSNLASSRQDWISASFQGRAHATSLVNYYLSQKYMDAMDMGVLSDMPNIHNKACHKLHKKQEFNRSGVLSAYKHMVDTVVCMINANQSMRCFSQGVKSSAILQFSTRSDDTDDAGDGGGIPVFTFLPITAFEALAQELVEMFKLELILKRSLVVELLCASCVKTEPTDLLSWSDELYQGETDELRMCNLYMEETSKPVIPRVQGWRCDADAIQSSNQLDQEVLQVYLTTWLVEVNLDTHRYGGKCLVTLRVDEILSIVGEEMRTSFL